MSWIKTIPYHEAAGRLKKIYDRIKGPKGTIDNVLLIHGLRPHTLSGHMGLYKSVLHHSGNSLPKWYLEALGVYVSHLNKCSYCIDHHLAGVKRLLGPEDSVRLWQAIESESLDDFFSKREIAGFQYARMLTLTMEDMTRSTIESLRVAGLDDGEILEINQVVSYFNYVNRTVLGLGVTTEGDQLGLSPNDSEDPENWSHE